VDWPSGARSTQFTKEGRPKPELTNLWYVYRIRHAERFSWHTAFALSRFFFLVSFGRPGSLYCEEYECVYMHISEWVQTDYELPLLQSNTASEIFVNKSRAVRSVDWLLIIGAPAWR
jgi:hypothetical protein